MLTFALLMSARMGIFQETLYKQYGKHSKEALFYNVRVNPKTPVCIRNLSDVVYLKGKVTHKSNCNLSPDNGDI